MAEMNEVLTEIKKTHELLKLHVDKQIEEVRATGYSRADTDSQVNTINIALGDLREKYNRLDKEANEIRAISQRPQYRDSDKRKTEEEIRTEKAFEKFVRFGAGERGKAYFSDEEMRALSPSTDAMGQYLVPTSWESDLITFAYEQAEIRPVSNVATTGRDKVFIPSLSKVAVSWGHAALEIPETQLTAGGEHIDIHDLRCLILIHNNTLEDADADIWGELSTMGSLAVSEAEDDAFANGTGVNEPKGLISDSRVQANYTPSGVAAALNDATHNGVDALTDMFYSIKKTYRTRGVFAFNSVTEGVIRKLKDANGQYLWQPPVQAGNPATLLGRPVINPEGMPDIAANTYPIVFGDFRMGYRIRDRRGITVQRLVERYAEKQQTGFILTRRVGAQVTLPEAFACVKISVT